jgi:hypothetical protein
MADYFDEWMQVFTEEFGHYPNAYEMLLLHEALTQVKEEVYG